MDDKGFSVGSGRIKEELLEWSTGGKPQVVSLRSSKINGFLEGFWIESDNVCKVSVLVNGLVFFRLVNFVGSDYVPFRVQSRLNFDGEKGLPGMEFSTFNSGRLALNDVVEVVIEGSRECSGSVRLRWEG